MCGAIPGFVLQVSHMADTKSRSIRVEDALWVKFCAMNGTQNEAFRALIEQMESAKKGPDLLQKIYERALAMELKLEEILETEDK